MTAAQCYLLSSRSTSAPTGCARSPTRSPPRWAAARPPSDAINKIAGQMQAFLASDVSTRSASRRSSRRRSTTTGSAASRSPAPVPARHRVAGAADRRRPPRPQREQQLRRDRGPAGAGLHGHGLVHERRRRHAAARGARRGQPRPGRDPTFAVKFANQGDNDETNVKVAHPVSGHGQADHGHQDDRPDEGQDDVDRDHPARQGAAGRHAVPRSRSSIAKVPGEKNTTTTSTSYTVIFTR